MLPHFLKGPEIHFEWTTLGHLPIPRSIVATKGMESVDLLSLDPLLQPCHQFPWKSRWLHQSTQVLLGGEKESHKCQTDVESSTSQSAHMVFTAFHAGSASSFQLVPRPQHDLCGSLGRQPSVLYICSSLWNLLPAPLLSHLLLPKLRVSPSEAASPPFLHASLAPYCSRFICPLFQHGTRWWL